MGLPRVLYFIDRAREKPEHHVAPYHRYLICTDRKRAFWEAGDTHDGAWIWQRDTIANDGCGWLLLRWKGLDIDHGTVVRGGELPDGAIMGFTHPHRDLPPWNVLDKTVWWSEKDIPLWLRARGVDRPADEFSLKLIKERLDFLR